MGQNEIAFRFVNVDTGRATSSTAYFTLEQVRKENAALARTMYRWIPEKAIKAWIANNKR